MWIHFLPRSFYLDCHRPHPNSRLFKLSTYRLTNHRLLSCTYAKCRFFYSYTHHQHSHFYNPTPYPTQRTLSSSWWLCVIILTRLTSWFYVLLAMAKTSDDSLNETRNMFLSTRRGAQKRFTEEASGARGEACKGFCSRGTRFWWGKGALLLILLRYSSFS